MIIILLINIETLFSKNIRFKASLKYKIFVLQLQNKYKKITNYSNIFYIRYNIYIVEQK